MGVYEGGSWRIIQEHVNDILGKQFREAAAMAGGSVGMGGDNALPRALEHLMALLDCPNRPAATQQRYLDQFIDVARKVQTKQVS